MAEALGEYVEGDLDPLDMDWLDDEMDVQAVHIPVVPVPLIVVNHAEAGHLMGDLPQVIQDDHLAQGSLLRRPYKFQSAASPPASLYMLAINKVLARYNTGCSHNKCPLKWLKTSKKDLAKQRRQLSSYLGHLPDPIKADLMKVVFNDRIHTYRQAMQTTLDRGMYDNEICCTYPDECSSKHEPEFNISDEENVLLWKILQGKQSTELNLLPFMELQPKILDICRDNQIKMIEAEICKSPKMVLNVQTLKFVGTYRNYNLGMWSRLLPTMVHLQSIELHYWSCDAFLFLIQTCCKNLKEIILTRQKCSSLGRPGRALENLPSLVTAFQHSLKVLIVDVGSSCFDPSMVTRLHKSLANVENLECLKLEARESPYLHWNNCRYQVSTKLLIMTLRRSARYLDVVRNVNRCFSSTVKINLHYDTYVDIDTHKHAFFSQGPIVGGGENTVSQSTRDFESGEVCTKFWRLMSEFGGKVCNLSAETDIRPQYFQLLFPNMESMELFSRASRKVPYDPRFSLRDVSLLKRLVMEADPAFSAVSVDQLLLHVLGDVFSAAPALETVKVLAAQSGLQSSEYSFLLRLNETKHNLQQLTTVEFVSPFCISNNGLTSAVAKWFVANCPKLELLRDVASWTGTLEAWKKVEQEATKRGLRTCWAEKTRRVALYTIDYDAESWVQADTGHQFELYNNLNDDWEVVDEEVEDFIMEQAVVPF